MKVEVKEHETKFANFIKDNNIITNVSISIVNHCNSNCIFCLLDKRKDTKGFIDKNLFLSILHQLRDIGTLEIELTGGEPFLHPDIKYLLSNLYDYNFTITITTNGILVPDGLSSVLDSSNLKYIRVSIHGVNANTHDFLVRKKGAFKEVINNLFRMKDMGVNLEVIFLVNRYNYKEVEDAYNFWKKHEIKIGFSYLIMGNNNDNLYLDSDDLKSSLKTSDKFLKDDIFYESGCSAMRNSLFIDYNGNVMPCITFPFLLGNLKSTSLNKIMQKKIFLQLRNEITKYTDKLKNAGIHHCPGNNFVTTGNINKANRYSNLLMQIAGEIK